jgi:hypothetical protein
MQIGAPVVKPLNTPESISALSSSKRDVPTVETPGFLLSNSI